MPLNAFKRNLKRTPPMIGVWSMSGSAMAAEALGFAGYDFVVLDMEHAPNDAPRVFGLLQAAAGSPASPVVRLQWNDTVTVKQLLDFGAQTLMFPYIQDADEARRAVAATRYPPDGVRGFAGMSRATRYGAVADYHRNAANEICVILQLETKKAVANLEEIAAVPGVDCIFIGPGDLSADMGFIGQPGHPEVQNVLADAAGRCAKLGMPSGILAGGSAQARDYLGYGFSWVASGSDLGLMMSNARSELRNLRSGG
ncbi:MULTISPECIES: HpcH/HpaI aldolase/citrate lyase family protein [unclassified Sinorhizobium]|uniref:HpcH/HpaI aldolase family protein n=1 Tax=unclassified Sinorhizobium TaxID=2613772 RepID=UPI0024C37A36|nr:MULTISPECIES: HpcH/HpaI aldolase/citrate lyase family protein [unclassified Sinorhizobium]MDK1377294.1 HpcH/HpaI aldolase/citrate lyase family protein [Sinorhizobium sp. 6-70]MDK1481905.1 HpcH/HpaI aldolase/citrate lyase family protein [Sinorhizobium sp. 6-117]